MAENQDYTKSVNLPSTDFPMRGNLPQREPETLKYWEDIDLYNRLKKKNKGKKPFIHKKILHRNLMLLYQRLIVGNLTDQTEYESN